MKTDTVFKRAFNDAIEMISKLGDGEPLPSESAFSSTLGVSRTTVRKIIATLAARGVVTGTGRQRTVRATRKRMQRFPEAETVSASAQLERSFMEWMLRENTLPGTLINELELARRFGVATTGIREFLNQFQRFGLIEKRPNGGWVFHGFTESFALELFEIREMFELRSAMAFAALPEFLRFGGKLKRCARSISPCSTTSRAATTIFPISTGGFIGSSVRLSATVLSTASTTSSRSFSIIITSGTSATRGSATRSRFGAPRLYRGAAQPEHRVRQTRLQGASRVGKDDLNPVHITERPLP